MSLLEALNTAKKEIDSQGVRVRHLEELLKEERRARESAEERARYLSIRSKTIVPEQAQSLGLDTDNPDSETESILITSPISTLADSNGVKSDSSMDSPIALDIQDVSKKFESKEPSKLPAQEKLNILIREMDEMKVLVESYKRRAESAEEEKKTTLAEMVERIRTSEENTRLSRTGLQKRRSAEFPIETKTAAMANGSAEPKSHEDGALDSKPSIETNGKIDASAQQIKQLQHALATALSSQHHDARLAQSAPYASILGVVLIGVGLMTYLNGWQKVER